VTNGRVRVVVIAVALLAAIARPTVAAPSLNGDWLIKSADDDPYNCLGLNQGGQSASVPITVDDEDVVHVELIDGSWSGALEGSAEEPEADLTSDRYPDVLWHATGTLNATKSTSDTFGGALSDHKPDGCTGQVYLFRDASDVDSYSSATTSGSGAYSSDTTEFDTHTDPNYSPDQPALGSSSGSQSNASSTRPKDNRLTLAEVLGILGISVGAIALAARARRLRRLRLMQAGEHATEPPNYPPPLS
jgi:hypothetical protein